MLNLEWKWISGTGELEVEWNCEDYDAQRYNDSEIEKSEAQWE